MSGNNLFGDKDISTITGEQALAALVGEGKKYATPEELAKAAAHSQEHITKLEQESASFRDASLQAKGVDDILAALRASPPADGNQPPAQQEQSGAVDVDALIAAALGKRDEGKASAQAQANVESVKATLTKAYGDKAGEVYTKVGNELGVDLDKLAEQSPEAALKLITGGQQQTLSTGLPTGLQGTLDNNGDALTYAKIQTLYKEGKLKRHEKIALENEQLTKLGREVFWKK